MSSIFHYTSNEGVFGILSSGVLHATHFDYLNDPQEMRHLREIVNPIFELEFRKTLEKYIEAGVADGKSLAEFGNNVFASEAELLWRSAFETAQELTPSFLVSFCRHEEGSEEYHHGLLSQWRGYGSVAGCAIEFDEEKMRELIKEERIKSGFTFIDICNVHYEDHCGLLEGAPINGVAAAMYENHFNPGQERQADLNRKIDSFYNVISQIAPRLKARAFREENECRITASCMRQQVLSHHPDRVKNKIHIRFRDGMPVPYIKLFENTGQNLPIKRILIGPQRHQSRVEYALRVAAEEHRLVFDVARSEISYVA